MLVGEISRKSGLSKDTIRFYEKRGLITVDRSDSAWNNYKNYDEKTLNRLLQIKRAKHFGFTLNEIAEILDLFETDSANCPTLSLKIKEKLTQIDTKIGALQAMKETIIEKVRDIGENCLSLSHNGNCRSLHLQKEL